MKLTLICVVFLPSPNLPADKKLLVFPLICVHWLVVVVVYLDISVLWKFCILKGFLLEKCNYTTSIVISQFSPTQLRGSLLHNELKCRNKGSVNFFPPITAQCELYWIEYWIGTGEIPDRYG